MRVFGSPTHVRQAQSPEARLQEVRDSLILKRTAAIGSYVVSGFSGMVTVGNAIYAVRDALYEYGHGQDINLPTATPTAVFAGLTILAFGSGVLYSGETRVQRAEMLRLQSEQVRTARPAVPSKSRMSAPVR